MKKQFSDVLLLMVSSHILPCLYKKLTLIVYTPKHLSSDTKMDCGVSAFNSS